MSHITLNTLYGADQTLQDNGHMQRSYDALTNDIEQLLTSARPRLLRLAQKQGVTLDDADDIVQETLIEAWKHLDHLRAPERFDAWLNGICRNVCLRWARSRGTASWRETYLSALDVTQQDASEEITDPQIIDPAEELSRQDLAVLLDRALAHVPEDHRELLELCYLAELPRREVAARLGLTISALEARLHRARRQLHHVLNGALRAEAETFGLALEPREDREWRESREWCMFCGHHRLQGIFEQALDGGFSLRMRCPACGPIIHSGIGILQRSYHSFRPALKQLRQIATDFFIQGLARGGWQTCMICGARQQIAIIDSLEDELMRPDLRPGLFLILSCPVCQSLTDCYLAGIACYNHPRALAFMEQHPRWITTPETYVIYQGQQAIHIRMIDITSAAQLTLLVHPRTLNILAIF